MASRLELPSQEVRHYWWMSPTVDGPWGDVASWNWKDRLPGPHDIAHIEWPIPPTVHAAVDLGDYTVGSVVSNHVLEVTRGSLTVLDQATLGPAAVVHVREGGRFNVEGIADFGDAQVSATEGGTVSLRGALQPFTKGIVASGIGSTFEITGAGFLTGVDSDPFDPGLPSLTARDGAHLVAPSVGTVRDLEIRAEGIGSEADLPGLGRLGVLGGRSVARLVAKDGGVLKTPQLTQATGGEILIDGPTSRIDLTRLESIDFLSLRVLNGAVVELPAVTTHQSPYYSSALESTGPGSLIDLPNLVKIGVESHPAPLQALAGGEVRLLGLTAIDAAAAFTARGAGSVVDLSNLVSFEFANTVIPGAELNAVDGGRIRTGSLRSLANVGLVIDGRESSIDLDQVSGVVSGLFTARNGGSIAMTAPTAMVGHLSAEGPLSLVSLPNVTQVGNYPGGFPMTITARVGGQIDLTSVESMTSGAVLAATGRDARIQLPRLAGLESLDLTVEDGAAVELDALGSIGRGRIRAQGATDVPLSRVTRIGNLDALVTEGAALGLPSLQTIRLEGAGAYLLLDVRGAGSRIDAPALREIARADTWPSSVDVVANDGGTIDLSGLAELPTNSVRFRSDGAGSLIRLDSLVTTAGSLDNVTLEAADGGTLRAERLTRVEGALLGIDGADSRLEFPLLSTWSNSSLGVSAGATLSLPRIVEIELNRYLSAAGVGSLLELRAVQEIVGSGQVAASGGARIELPALQQLGDGQHATGITVTGAGSMIYAPALHTFLTPPLGLTPPVQIGVDEGQFVVGSLELSNAAVRLQHGGLLVGDSLILSSDASLTGSGTIAANLDSRGEIKVMRSDPLRIQGGFVQGAQGAMKFEWGYGTPTNPLVVDEVARLDGAAEFRLLGPLQLGDSLRLLDAREIVGNFQSGEQLLDTSRLLTTAVVGQSVWAVVALPGDANLDGRVDLNDFGALKAHFGFGRTLEEGDFSGDNVANLMDFGLIKLNFGRTDGPRRADLRRQALAIPEPQAATLLLVGLAALGVRLASRRFQAQRPHANRFGQRL